MECDQIDYRTTMDWEGDNIKIGFHNIPPNFVHINNHQVETGPIQPTSPETECQEFGPKPDTDSTEFDFKIEVEWLPFKLSH